MSGSLFQVLSHHVRLSRLCCSFSTLCLLLGSQRTKKHTCRPQTLQRTDVTTNDRVYAPPPNASFPATRSTAPTAPPRRDDARRSPDATSNPPGWRGVRRPTTPWISCWTPRKAGPVGTERDRSGHTGEEGHSALGR